MYCAENVAHGMDFISPYFSFVRWKTQMYVYLTMVADNYVIQANSGELWGTGECNVDAFIYWFESDVHV